MDITPPPNAVNPTEISVGNYLSNGNGNFFIDESTLFDIWESWKESQICWWEPVPLTTEWLTKFDFFTDEEMPNNWRKSAGRKTLILVFEDNLIHYFYQKDIGEKYQDLHLNYDQVHQLQNLYYWLMEEKLQLP